MDFEKILQDFGRYWQILIKRLEAYNDKRKKRNAIKKREKQRQKVIKAQRKAREQAEYQKYLQSDEYQERIREAERRRKEQEEDDELLDDLYLLGFWH